MREHKIKLRDKSIITINEDELLGFQITDIDLSYKAMYKIYNKKDFLNYILMLREQQDSIDYAQQFLEQELNITYKRQTFERFAPYDVVAYSAHTEDNTKELIVLEFKHRTGNTAFDYDSIVVDKNKCDELNKISKEHKVKAFVVNVYKKDGKIRFFNLTNQHHDGESNKNIVANRWLTHDDNNTKNQKLYHFNNHRTLLIN